MAGAATSTMKVSSTAMNAPTSTTVRAGHGAAPACRADGGTGAVCRPVVPVGEVWVMPPASDGPGRTYRDHLCWCPHNPPSVIRAVPGDDCGGPLPAADAAGPTGWHPRPAANGSIDG
ncbi:hypothetical protein Sliba_36780 [Streptomyces nigrescens]|uniref:Uncharacterized protein n=1 Tax=Streptomyces nigrescens TaxID=1920 RepID=A0A640TMJ4_STRNI|nr:hypothetical protein Sliba_36780 [Streptomyces libani subsp. libani]GGV92424.1 hypothetical protein GCM10010500_25480 [Streptomyces libani subsp. libani]